MANWFASPASLWLGLLIGPLLLLYMLRHKPVRKRVPAIVLWTGVAQAQIATSPFQRLRRSLSLLLMLIALTALVLALAGLRVPGGEVRGLPVTIVVDTTASMQAFEPGGSRFSSALENTLEVIDAAGNSSFTLLAWDGNLIPVTPANVDADAARRAVDSLEVTQRGASDASLVKALEQLSEDGNRRVVLVSDHAPGELSRALFVPAGTPKLNAAIVTASLSEPRPGQTDLFCGVDLYAADQPVLVSVVLERLSTRAFEITDARDVRLQPGVRNAVTFENVRPGLYRIVLKIDDGLILDNTAYLRFSRLPVQDVVLTGEPPEPLARVVQAIEETMGMIRRVEPGNEDQETASYILTDAASAGTQPRIPSAYIAPGAAPPGVEFGEVTDVPEGATRPNPSYLWRGAGTPDIRVEAIFPVQTNRYFRPVLETGPGAAVGLLKRDTELEDLVVAFPIDERSAGFTGRVAFLIFWANWFDHVRRQRDPLPRGAVSTRDSLTVRPMGRRGEFQWGALDAESLRTSMPGRALMPEQAGVYRFENLADTDLPVVGVSLLDEHESNIASAEQTALESTALEEWMNSFEGEGERRDLDLRPWLALLAASLLLFDWFWFRRKFPTQTNNSRNSGAPK